MRFPRWRNVKWPSVVVNALFGVMPGRLDISPLAWDTSSVGTIPHSAAKGGSR